MCVYVLVRYLRLLASLFILVHQTHCVVVAPRRCPPPIHVFQALKPPVDARGCVLAMFLHIKTGSYDALLKWPFPIPFTLTVYGNSRHCDLHHLPCTPQPYASLHTPCV